MFGEEQQNDVKERSVRKVKMHFTITERIQIVKWVLSGNSYRKTQEQFLETYPDRPVPSISSISRLMSKFNETGSVQNLKHKRTHTAGTEQNSIDVLAYVQAHPHCSITKLAEESGLSKSNVYRLLKKGLYHPYKIVNLQELNEDDPDRRMQFCEWAMNTLQHDANFFSGVCFTDEATFSLHGEVNRHNCRYWSDNNPHWMHETGTQRPQKLNVWAGLLGQHMIGPFFIDGYLNGDSYLRLLQEEVGPEIENLAMDGEIWFQQDGAPPHFYRPVREYLNDVFPNAWIGRRGPVEWPARSPDLAPNDFFLWGHIKSVIYTNRPEDLNELRDRITDAINQISHEQLRNVETGFRDRVGHCLAVNGSHFEHLL